MTRRRRRESGSDAERADFYGTTDEEFDAQCDRLVSLLAPDLSNSARWNIYDRIMSIDFKGRQVERLLRELTLLAEYKASLEVRQAKCPPQLVKPKRERPWAGVNSPPPTDRSGWQVRNSLMVGDRGWIAESCIYRDEHSGLWCEGTAYVRQKRAEGCVPIERTDRGVRVLEWPDDDVYGERVNRHFIQLREHAAES
jgi:hypothetical protein